jgi:glycosyltransferase involved in cell wall biosynthesis
MLGKWPTLSWHIYPNMRLLIIAQKVDKNDPILGFFHGWISEFSKKFKSVAVICLFRGAFDLPDNVAVLSLGKEKWKSKFKYIFLLFYFSLRYFNRYDAVFVHMNEEYPVLAGWLWRLMGKKVYMWRNHHAGNKMTDIAALFCNNVFCTSKYSYTATYKKTILMPLGIDTTIFKVDTSVQRVPRSILSLGRIAPSKNLDILIDALGLLKKYGHLYSLSVYGDALPKDVVYERTLKQRVVELGLNDRVVFYAGIPNTETPEVYSRHDIFVNISSNGMYDKTIAEAMACGCVSLASNDNLRGRVDDQLIISERSAESVATSLVGALSMSGQTKDRIIRESMSFAEQQSLKTLTSKLYSIIRS